MAGNNELIEVLRGGVVHEPTTLASGQAVESYVDVRRVLLGSAAGAAVVYRLIADAIAYRGMRAVGAVPTGGLLLLTPVLNWLYGVYGLTPAGFYVRAVSKEHGRGRRLEGRDPDELVGASGYGGGVVLLEDVVSTGLSVCAAVDFLIGAGVRVDCVVAVVDRDMGGAEELGARGVGLLSLAGGEEIGLD